MGGRGERVKVKGREARKIKDGSGCKELKVHRRYNNKVRGRMGEGKREREGELKEGREGRKEEGWV